jgi:hypothetical protein
MLIERIAKTSLNLFGAASAAGSADKKDSTTGKVYIIVNMFG